MGLSGYVVAVLLSWLILGQQPSTGKFDQGDASLGINDAAFGESKKVCPDWLNHVNGADLGARSGVWRAAHWEHVSRVKSQPKGKTGGQLIDFYSVGAKSHWDRFAGHDASQREGRGFSLSHVLHKICLSQVDGSDSWRRKVQAPKIGNVGCWQAADIRQAAFEPVDRQTRSISFECHDCGQRPTEPWSLFGDENLAAESISVFCRVGRGFGRVGSLFGVVEAFADDPELDIKKTDLKQPDYHEAEREIGGQVPLPPIFPLYMILAGVAGFTGALGLCRATGVWPRANSDSRSKDRHSEKRP